MVIVIGSWWGPKPECVISAASYHSFQREEYLCSSLSKPASSTGLTCPIHSAVLYVEYILVYCSSFGNFRYIVTEYLFKVSLQSFPYLLSEYQGGEFQTSATKSKTTLGAGSNSWCCAVVVIGSKKHLVTGKVTPAAAPKREYITQFSFLLPRALIKAS